MKRLIRTALLACLGFPFASLRAQITIQETDVQKIFTPHATIKLYRDTSSYVSVGDTGGPRVYDFSSLAFADTMTNTIYTASDFPFLAARFDPASMIWSNSTQRIDGNSLFMLSSSSFINVAQVTIFDSLEEIAYNVPPEAILQFPATYGSTWSTSPPGAGSDSTFINNSFTNVTTGWNSAETYVVDGYGTFIFKGVSHQCIRVRDEEVSTYTAKDFVFVTRDGIVTVVESTKDQNDTGKVKVKDINCIVASSVTSVARHSTEPSAFSLSQNYPNPFNPTTRVDFEVPTRGLVTLEVYDVLGRRVATLAHEELAAGSYERTFDAGQLPSGVYFDRLVEGSSVRTSKLMLLK